MDYKPCCGLVSEISTRKEDARGWYASMQALADALPFRVNRMTVARSVDKLLNLGLVSRRENSLFITAQNVQNVAQNEHEIAQNEHEIAQNEQKITPPNNPLLNNNNMMKENSHTHVHTHDAELQTPSFDDFLRAFGRGFTPITRDSAEMKWNQCSEAKKQALVAALNDGKWDKPRPDWCIGDFPEPEPEFLRGDEPGDLVQVKYRGAFKICTRETMKIFGLEYVRNWKQ